MQGNHGLIGNDAGSKFATMTSLAKVVMVKCDQARGHILRNLGWNFYESRTKKCQNLV